MLNFYTWRMFITHTSSSNKRSKTQESGKKAYTFVQMNPKANKSVSEWFPVKERILFKIATNGFRFFDSTLYHISSYLSVYTPFRTLRSSFDKNNSSLCKMETQGLWSLLVLCSGTACLEQPFSPHPTRQFPFTVQNFS